MSLFFPSVAETLARIWASPYTFFDLPHREPVDDINIKIATEGMEGLTTKASVSAGRRFQIASTPSADRVVDLFDDVTFLCLLIIESKTDPEGEGRKHIFGTLRDALSHFVGMPKLTKRRRVEVRRLAREAKTLLHGEQVGSMPPEVPWVAAVYLSGQQSKLNAPSMEEHIERLRRLFPSSASRGVHRGAQRYFAARVGPTPELYNSDWPLAYTASLAGAGSGRVNIMIDGRWYSKQSINATVPADIIPGGNGTYVIRGGDTSFTLAVHTGIDDNRTPPLFVRLAGLDIERDALSVPRNVLRITHNQADPPAEGFAEDAYRSSWSIHRGETPLLSRLFGGSTEGTARSIQVFIRRAAESLTMMAVIEVSGVVRRILALLPGEAVPLFSDIMHDLAPFEGKMSRYSMGPPLLGAIVVTCATVAFSGASQRGTLTSIRGVLENLAKFARDTARLALDYVSGGATRDEWDATDEAFIMRCIVRFYSRISLEDEGVRIRRSFGVGLCVYLVSRSVSAMLGASHENRPRWRKAIERAVYTILSFHRPRDEKGELIPGGQMTPIETCSLLIAFYLWYVRRYYTTYAK